MHHVADNGVEDGEQERDTVAFSRHAGCTVGYLLRRTEGTGGRREWRSRTARAG